MRHNKINLNKVNKIKEYNVINFIGVNPKRINKSQ